MTNEREFTHFHETLVGWYDRFLKVPAQVTIAQEKMQFIPAVSLVPVGAKIQFINNDPWDLHVRSSPAGMGQFNATNAGFELRLEGKTEGKPAKATEISIDKAGVIGSTLLGCFIHGSMRGYVFASESPWAVKTGGEARSPRKKKLLARFF